MENRASMAENTSSDPNPIGSHTATRASAGRVAAPTVERLGHASARQTSARQTSGRHTSARGATTRAGSLRSGPGRYRLERRIATGATTSVWRATDTLMDRTVAVKRLRHRSAGDQTARARFAEEIRINASMHHPSVIEVLDADPLAARPYLVTEWVEGETLEEVLRRGHLPPTTAIRIAEALAWALAHVHDRGAIHCDVKPSNVLVRNDGQVKLADFGIATPTGLTHDGTVFGSIHYMSPERLVGGAPSPACDVYALGVTLYEMITGRRPFTGQTPFEVALSHRRAEGHRSGPITTSAFSRIPATVDAAIRTALAQDPEDRYPSAASFAVGLRGADRSGDHQTLAG